MCYKEGEGGREGGKAVKEGKGERGRGERDKEREQVSEKMTCVHRSCVVLHNTPYPRHAFPGPSASNIPNMAEILTAFLLSWNGVRPHCTVQSKAPNHLPKTGSYNAEA